MVNMSYKKIQQHIVQCVKKAKEMYLFESLN